MSKPSSLAWYVFHSLLLLGSSILPCSLLLLCTYYLPHKKKMFLNFLLRFKYFMEKTNVRWRYNMKYTFNYDITHTSSHDFNSKNNLCTVYVTRSVNWQFPYIYILVSYLIIISLIRCLIPTKWRYTLLML